MGLRRHLVRFAAAASIALAVAAAAPVFAHGEGVLDIEDLEALVVSRSAGTIGREHRIYATLAKSVGRAVRRPFFDELTKLDAVAEACSRRLAGDEELVALLAAGVAQADAYCDGRDEQVEAVVRNLERPKDRAAARGIAADGTALLEAARAEVTETRRLTLLRRSGSAFARAEKLARKLILAQFRRGAPGQPVSKGPSGTIDTYVGTGAQNVDSKPRPALGSSFSNPADVALGADGLLHIVDLNNNLIRRLDTDGFVRNVAGTGRLGDETGPPLESDMHHPSGIAFHPLTGEMFIAGWHSARVLKIDATSGNLVYVAGSGELGFAGDGGPSADAVVDYPSGLAFAADGTWYLADQGNRRVRVVDGTSGTITTLAGTGVPGFSGDAGPAIDAQFNLPNGQTADVSGRVCLAPGGRFLFVADTGNHRVRCIDLHVPGNTIVTYAGTGTAASGSDVGDGGPAVAAALNAPVDVDCDSEGNLLICERDGCRIRKVDRITGEITTIAGSGVRGFTGDRGDAKLARLDGPNGIAVDRLRNRLYIADTLNHVVRVVWE